MKTWRSASKVMEGDDTGITEAIAAHEEDLRAAGINLDKLLGCGAEGCVFQARKGCVAKISERRDEYLAAQKFGGKHPSLPIVHAIIEFEMEEPDHPGRHTLNRDVTTWYAIIREDIKDIPGAEQVHNDVISGWAQPRADWHANTRKFLKARGALMQWFDDRRVRYYDLKVSNWGRRKDGTYVLRDLGGIEDMAVEARHVQKRTNPAPVGTILFEVVNKEDGTTGLVVRGAKGKFHACLRDDESGNVIGVVRIEPTFERAKSVAVKWANA